MTWKNTTGTLENTVAPGETFTAPYSPGSARGDFLGGHGNSLVIGQSEYSDSQFSVALDATGAIVTNQTEATWLQGVAFVLSLAMPGEGDGWQSNDGKNMPRVQAWPVVYLNLGSPVAEDEEGLRAGAPIEAAGPVALLATKFDVPRNITFHSDATESVIFTVKSTDEYGAKVTEEVTGAEHGKKCHFSGISVSVSGPASGNVQIGWGPEIGLPCFVPAAAVILKELQDGEPVATPGVVIFGDDGPPSVTSGDVRGTYESEVTPDGSRAFGLLCCLPDPGYLGADQFNE